jgi:hypothetical protein
MCWDSGPNRAFKPEGTEPDYWYLPGPYPSTKKVDVAAWGYNPMPANSVR